MILRRLSASLRAQNLTAISIEFVLVVAGVFLGIQASNWNEDRQAKQELRVLLSQVQTELSAFGTYLDGVRKYYEITDGYAQRATAGWTGEGEVSDTDFVIAAYQASQITAVGNDATTWSVIFGADKLRDIDDISLRNSLIRIMTFDYSTVGLGSVATPYRQNVRRAIPGDVQALIRKRCGDRWTGTPANSAFLLPERCDLALPAGKMKIVAERLRANPELLDDLHWHRAAVDSQLLNVGTLKALSLQVLTKLRE